MAASRLFFLWYLFSCAQHIFYAIYSVGIEVTAAPYAAENVKSPWLDGLRIGGDGGLVRATFIESGREAERLKET